MECFALEIMTQLRPLEWLLFSSFNTKEVHLEFMSEEFVALSFLV